MNQNKRLKLTLPQKLTHYGIVIFMLLIVSFTLKSLFEIYVTKTYTGVRTAEEQINSCLPFLILAVIFAFIQYRRLNFKECKISFTEPQFQEAVKRTETQLEWRIEKNNRFQLIAHRRDWLGSWGELITIIKERDKVFINSICDPDRMSSIVSYGWNRKNIKTFLKNLNDVLDSKPIEVKIEKKTNEWSAKRIFIRLFAYPFCVFLIAFGVYALLNPRTARGSGAAIGGIIAASVYLYSDIRILTKKK